MKSQKKEIESLQEQLAETPIKTRAAIDVEVNQAVREIKEDRERLRLSVTGLESINLDLEKRLAETLAEMKGLRERARRSTEVEGDVEQLRRQVEVRSEEKVKLEDVIRRLQEKLNDSELKLQKGLERLLTKTQENEALKKDLNNASSEVSSLRKDLERRMQNDSSKKLTAELSQKSAENERLCEEVAGLEDRLNALNEDNVRLKQGLTQSEETCRSLRKQLELREGDLNRLTGEIGRKTMEITNIRKIHEEELLRMKAGTSRAPVLDTAVGFGTDKQKEENARLKYELKDCQGRLEKVVTELEAERSRQRESLLEKDRNIARLQRNLNEQHLMSRRLDGDGRESGSSDDFKPNAKEDISDGRNLAEKNRKQLEAELLHSEQRCSELESKLGSLKHELRSMEVDRDHKVTRLEAQLAELNTKLAGADRRNRRLEQERTVSSAGSRTLSAEEKSDRAFNILSLLQSPIGDEPNANIDAVSQSRQIEGIKSAGMPGELEKELAEEIVRLRKRVSELEAELKKAKKQISLDTPDGKDDVCVGPDSQRSHLVSRNILSIICIPLWHV